MKQYILKFPLLCFALLIFSKSYSATKTSAASGSWSAAATWSPSGVPGSNDNVIIAAGHTVLVDAHKSCKKLTINTGGTLIFTGGKKLTLDGDLTVNGTCNTNDGNLLQDDSGAAFILGPGAVFNWQPEQNNVPHASLWINSIESFSPTSNLLINAWYDADVPLGSLVTGNFGNLTMSSNLPGWKQNDAFVTHLVKGTFTVDGDYIILNDINSAASSTTVFNDVVLASAGSYLDFFDGTKTGAVIVNAANLTINGGELNMFNLSGTGTATLNLSGNLTIESAGLFIGANNNDASTTVNIAGNMVLNGGVFKGCDDGDGNHIVAIAGNLLNNISGTPGEYYGVQDGNGNATLTVSGNIVNSGYMDLIWNSGFSGVGNGNGTMTVGGSFTQTQGDFRGIYNLTTTNAGIVTITVNSLTFSGGTFMGHYACHTGAGTNIYTVTNDLSITFSNASDVFRLNGLNLLATSQGTAAMTLAVGGNLSINGNTAATFISSASNGTESVTVEGTTLFNGGTVQFNNSTSHASNLLFKGNVSVNAGSTWMSYAPGTATVNLNANLTLTGGKLSVKNNTGAATVNVLGAYLQTAGTLSMYSNSTQATSDASVMNIYGSFTQNSGTVNFNENGSGTVPQIINIKGSSYTIGGDGIITSAAPADGNYYGTLNYSYSGSLTYSRSGSHSISKVSQYVLTGTTLLPSTNVQIAAINNNSNNSFYINSNGLVDLGTLSIFSEGSGSNAGVRINQNGTLRTAHLNGLYNGSSDAAFNASNGLTFDLDPLSIVEYYASDNQAVTGLGAGLATETKHKYGILKISFGGTPDAEYAWLSGTVYVRTRLELDGQLNLNNTGLVIESGNTTAISVSSGYIKSETNSASNNGSITWMNMTPATYIYPFGYSSDALIPVTVVPVSGGPSVITVSTRGTSPDNLPFTSGVSSMKSNGQNAASEGVIDRWWDISATAGTVANFTFSYRGSENSTSDATAAFAAQIYSGSNWTVPAGTGSGVTSGIGTVTANNISVFGPAVLSGANFALPIELAYFTVQPEGNMAAIKWATSSEKNNDFFSIERTGNGHDWEVIEKVKGSGTTHIMKAYQTYDKAPLGGKSYYRLKQTDYNGDFTYSPVRPFSLSSTGETMQAVSIESVSPNPFTDNFTMKFGCENEGEADIYITAGNGQVIHNQKIITTSGINYFDYSDEKSLPPGNYFITIIKADEKKTVKIIKR